MEPERYCRQNDVWQNDSRWPSQAWDLKGVEHYSPAPPLRGADVLETQPGAALADSLAPRLLSFAPAGAFKTSAGRRVEDFYSIPNGPALMVLPQPSFETVSAARSLTTEKQLTKMPDALDAVDLPMVLPQWSCPNQVLRSQTCVDQSFCRPSFCQKADSRK